MELKDLVGAHVLDAVDEAAEKVGGDSYDRDEVANVLRFRLDGVIYVAREDPSDGYRSSMRDLLIGAGDMTNVFSPCAVVATHATEARGCYGKCDLLTLFDCKTGKEVLVVGTSDIDDYYPSFVASFNPQNMAANAEAK